MTDFNIYEELMPKIQALIGAPDKRNKEKCGLDLHPYFKRKGKRHNHDYCDACGEKGNIVCCDICPASFHLLCHDPPLNEFEIPVGQWYCHSCKYMLKNDRDGFKRKLLRNKEDCVEVVDLTNDKDIHTSYNDKNQIIEENETDTVKNKINNNIENSDKNLDSKTGINHILNIDVNETNSRNNGRSKSLGQDALNESNVETFFIKDEFVELDEFKGYEFYPNEILKKEHEESSEARQNERLSCDVSKDDCAQSFGCVSIKSEPRSDYDDSSEDRDDGVTDLNMDDVCKIIGISKGVKIFTGRRYPQETLKNSDNSTSHTESTEDLLTKPCNVKLRHCDYLLKDINKSNDTSCVVENVDNNGDESRSSCVPDNLDDVTAVEIVLSDIINDAKRMNPKQFILSMEYITNIDLNVTGGEKDPDNYPNDLDASDLLKLPPRRCYYCNGTCLTGQMISCDFCPAHFHLNCLDPPMCSIPDVKWMCALHPHHILDKVMKNPSSITELMNWWSKLSTPVNDFDVKSKFVDKVKSIKRKPRRRPLTSAIKVPDIVKYHYKNPLPRVPSLHEFVYSDSTCIFRNNFMLTNHELIKQSNSCCDYFLDTEENKNTEYNSLDIEKGTEIVPVQNKNDNRTNINANLGSSSNYNLRRSKKFKKNALIEIVSDNVTENTTESKVAEIKPQKRKSSDEDLSIWDEVNKRFKFTSNGIYDEHLKNLSAVCLENGLSTSCATSCPPSFTSCPTSCWKSIENIIGQEIDKSFVYSGAAVTKLEETLRNIFVREEVKRIVKDYPPSFIPNSNPYPYYPPIRKENPNHVLPELPKRKVRAVLCPLTHHAPLIYMYDTTLSIGTDFASDVRLTRYGDCNFISPEHAIIFYDEVTRTYELLNYSEFATVVDGVYYACDISTRKKSLKKTHHRTVVDVDSNEKENLCYAKRKCSTPSSLKRSHSVSSVSLDSTDSKRKAGSTVMAVETRSIFKRLLQDIDKLVTKSQEEMNRVAEEDLKEISKAIKMNAESNPVQSETADKSKVKKKKSKNSDDSVASSSSKTARPKNGSKKANSRSSAEESSQSTKNDNEEEERNSLKSQNAIVRITKLRNARYGSKRKARRSKSERSESGGKVLAKMSQITPPLSDYENKIDNDDNREIDGKECLLPAEFSTVNGKVRCKCQLENLKFPNGRDDSWEKSAILYHGSYVRFGCVEFVFSIVNYPPPFEDRLYGNGGGGGGGINDGEEEAELSMRDQKNVTERQNTDLSARLISILNALSSKASSNNSSSSATTKSPPSSASDNASSPFSQLSSRSSSVVHDELGGDGDVVEVNYVDGDEAKNTNEKTDQSNVVELKTNETSNTNE